jgi:hypothetical protein
MGRTDKRTKKPKRILCVGFGFFGDVLVNSSEAQMSIQDEYA